MVKEAMLGMPNIRCSRCGVTIYIDAFSLPYIGDVACAMCRNVMDVEISSGGGARVRPKYSNPIESVGGEIWAQLNQIEQQSLVDASICMGNEAYTPSEFMALRALESVSRRCYLKLRPNAPLKTWFGILDDLSTETAFAIYSQGISYFRDVRNKVGHPDRISTRLDAESSYQMALRLIKELVEQFNP